MRDNSKIFFNKKILIYGLGKTGISSYKFLKKNNKVFLFDDNKKTSINKKKIIKSNFDYILISPGINVKHCILGNYIKKNLNKIITDLDVFYSHYPRNLNISITGTNGKSTTAKILFNILKDQKKDVRLVGNIGNAILNEKKISDKTIFVIEISSYQIEYSKNFKANYAAILNISPDLIHVHYLGWNGFLSLFFPKIPTVLTAWGSDIVFNSKNFIMKFLIKRMIKQSTVITCDAFHLKERLVELGSDTEKVKIIMFGINEDEFNYQRRPFELKNNHDKYIVGSIRNLHPVYDVITFLKAAKEVLKTREDVVFHVAGSGPDLKSLENFVEKHALQKHINFIGRLNSNQLLEFYESLDVYVSTSLSDGGIASSTAEAMLCQRPAIITNAAENGFWIEDQVNGRLFDCSDHINLSKIIFLALNRSRF